MPRPVQPPGADETYHLDATFLQRSIRRVEMNDSRPLEWRAEVTRHLSAALALFNQDASRVMNERAEAANKAKK